MDDRGDIDFEYHFDASTAGFIYYDRGGEQRFFRSWVEVNDLDFFPRNCTICDSNMGLLLCHRPHNTVPVRCVRLCRGKCRRRHRAFDPCDRFRYHAYSVCNPFLPDSTRDIPNSPNGIHPNRIPRVLVVHIHRTLSRFVFHIVCALMTDPLRRYTFDVYSSDTDAWTTSGPHDVLGRIREETGVSCNRRAYWLLEDRPLVVYYDVMDRSIGIIILPASYAALFRQPDVHLRSQLGRYGDALYFVATNEHWRALYGYNNGAWSCEEEKTYAYPRLPMLSRFQDGRVHVPFWFDSGALVIWDSRWGGAGADRVVCLEGPQRELGTDVLPLVLTRFHPVHHFGHMGSVLFFVYACMQFLGLDPLQ